MLWLYFVEKKLRIVVFVAASSDGGCFTILFRMKLGAKVFFALFVKQTRIIFKNYTVSKNTKNTIVRIEV